MHGHWCAESQVAFYYAGTRCRESVKLQPTSANLKRAAQRRAAILDAIEKGTFDYATTFPNSKRAATLTTLPGRAMTVSTYLDDWLARKEKTLKVSTANGYRKIVNGHLIPTFGKRVLADITRLDIKTWAAGNKSIANIMSCFRAALQEAFEDELIEANPLAGWVYRKAEAPKEEDDMTPSPPKNRPPSWP